MRRTLFLSLSIAAVALVGCFGSATTNDGSPGNEPPTDDSGAPSETDDGGSTTNPFDTPVVCTSNTHWTRGDHGSASMHPGGTCISCHTEKGGEAPALTIGGTVFPSAHEPTDCNGANAVTVIITGADGKTRTLTTNTAGNFRDSTAIALPYHAKIVANGKERAMSAAQTSGDCNSCHTETGANGAPGRIMAP